MGARTKSLRKRRRTDQQMNFAQGPSRDRPVRPAPERLVRSRWSPQEPSGFDLTRHQCGLQLALAEQPDFDDARVGIGDCATPREFLDANIWLRLHYDAKFSNAVGPTGT